MKDLFKENCRPLFKRITLLQITYLINTRMSEQGKNTINPTLKSSIKQTTQNQPEAHLNSKWKLALDQNSQGSDLENKSFKTRFLSLQIWFSKKPRQVELELFPNMKTSTNFVVQSLAHWSPREQPLLPLQTKEAAVLPTQKPHKSLKCIKALPKLTFGIDLQLKLSNRSC